MYVIDGYLMINKNVGICNTSWEGGSYTAEGWQIWVENMSAMWDSYFDKDMLL